MEHVEFIGCFLKRKNIFPIKIQQIVQELNYQLFETKIMLDAIDKIIHKNLNFFDSPVGDWKCQIRTAIIADIIYNNQDLEKKLYNESIYINQLIINIHAYLNKINSLNTAEMKSLSKNLPKNSIDFYLKQNDIKFNPSQELLFASLCFFIKLKNLKNLNLENDFISTNKLDQFCNVAKKILCNLTIKYEQDLALKYGSEEEQLLLQQIETKDIYSMVATYPSIKVLFKKMKKDEDLFIKKIIKFCICGGIEKVSSLLLQIKENIFVEKNLTDEIKDKVVMVIQGYQYPGSLKTLKELLKVPQELTYITKDYYKKCFCNKSPKTPIVISELKKVCLAAFAQHPQFTNGKQIDFEKLNMKNSSLYQEFTHLLSIPGCSINEMAQLHLDHCYPSTIKDALEEDIAFSTTVEQTATFYTMSHEHVNCPC